MRYLATRNLHLVYRDTHGKQRLGVIPGGSLTPDGAEIRGLEDLLALDLLRAVTPEHAANVARWTTVDTETAALNYTVAAAVAAR